MRAILSHPFPRLHLKDKRDIIKIIRLSYKGLKTLNSTKVKRVLNYVKHDWAHSDFFLIENLFEYVISTSESLPFFYLLQYLLKSGETYSLLLYIITKLYKNIFRLIRRIDFTRNSFDNTVCQLNSRLDYLDFHDWLRYE